MDLSKLHVVKYDGFEVEVIDPLQDYVRVRIVTPLLTLQISLLREIFDFDKIKSLLTRPDFKILLDSLNGGMRFGSCVVLL